LAALGVHRRQPRDDALELVSLRQSALAVTSPLDLLLEPPAQLRSLCRALRQLGPCPFEVLAARSGVGAQGRESGDGLLARGGEPLEARLEGGDALVPLGEHP